MTQISHMGRSMIDKLLRVQIWPIQTGKICCQCAKQGSCHRIHLNVIWKEIVIKILMRAWNLKITITRSLLKLRMSTREHQPTKSSSQVQKSKGTPCSQIQSLTETPHSIKMTLRVSHQSTRTMSRDLALLRRKLCLRTTVMTNLETVDQRKLRKAAYHK